MPFALSMSTNFIVQAIDSVMVAPHGSPALAAVAVAATVLAIPSALTMGGLTMVQKKVAEATSNDTSILALNQGLFFGALVSIPLAFIFYFLAEPIATLFASGQVSKMASTYIRFFAPALVFIAINQAFGGYWVGTSKTGIRLAVTIAAATINIIGNLILVPSMGVGGLALASAMAFFISSLINLILCRKKIGFKLTWSGMRDFREAFKVFCGVASHQLSLILTLNIAVYIVGRIGVEALAIANVVGVLSLPVLYLGIGYGTATGTLIVRALKNQKPEDARKIAALSLKQVLFVSGCFALVLLVGSDLLRRWFFRDPLTFEMAQVPFALLAILYLVDGVSCALQRFHFVTNGLRNSFLAMTLIQYGVFIPAAFVGVNYFGISYTSYLYLHILHRFLITLILFSMWILKCQNSNTEQIGQKKLNPPMAPRSVH